MIIDSIFVYFLFKQSKSPSRAKSPLRSSLRSSLRASQTKGPKEAWASSQNYDELGAEDGHHSKAVSL